MNQRQAVTDLVNALRASPITLQYARNIATAIVRGPSNHCAATLSALLVFVGIYPNGGGTGAGDLEPWVRSLAYDLEARRSWQRVAVTAQIFMGDVGIVDVANDTHHIYLVIDPADQANPLIADNQSQGMHQRPVAGDVARSFSPTRYFLRSPA